MLVSWKWVAILIVQIRHIWDDIHALQKAYCAQNEG